MTTTVMVFTLVAVSCAGVALTQHRSPQDRPPNGAGLRGHAARYSIEHAVSNRAQLHAIAFDPLALLTGGFGYDTFLPLFGQNARFPGHPTNHVRCERSAGDPFKGRAQ